MPPAAVSVRFTLWIKLTKAVLCIPIALSAGFGYILHAKEWDQSLFFIITAIFFLASGAATMNSLQERTTDALFERTRHRPLVTGEISPYQAGIASGLLLFTSLLILFQASSTVIPVLLALLGLLLYNGIYTPLKHRSGFTLLIGGIAGALPPLIGWTSAGGSILDIRVLTIVLLFFLWQVPHFFMVLLTHQNDYKKAKVYSLATVLSENALRRIALSWTLSMTIVIITLSALPFFLTSASRIINLIAAITILSVFASRLLIRKTATYRFLFHFLNGVFFADMALISTAEILLNP